MLPQEVLARLDGEGLRAIVSEPTVREAIFLASPSLDAELERWRSNSAEVPTERVRHSCFKYLTRMAARPTPFGLFATVATGTIGGETRLTASPTSEVRRRTRLDHEYLFNLCQALNTQESVRRCARFGANPTILTLPDSIRCIERRPGKELHTYHLVEVQRTPALDLVLAAVVEPCPFARLVEVTTDAGHRPEAVQRFLLRLIESQILISSIGVPVSGGPALRQLLDRIGDTPDQADLRLVLGETESLLQGFDAHGTGMSIDGYSAIARSVTPLGVEVDPHKLYQVDAARPHCGTLGEQVIHAIGNAVELLHRVGAPRRQAPLRDFLQAFEEHYQGRSIPLLEALDPDLGIADSLWPSSDSSPLIARLPLAPIREREVPWSGRERRLLRAVTEHAAGDSVEWILSEQDIVELTVDQPPLPDCGAAMAVLAAGSPGAIDRGEYQLHLASFEGPSGARLLGRFCDLDLSMREQVESHLRWEEARDPEAIFAEVVHLPEGRIGNVASRPALREHDLVISGQSGLPAERQIPVSDLLLSLVQGRLELHSRRLGRRIVPRLTSAHNYGTGLVLYRFLGLLQGQGSCAGLAWSWGPLEDAPFLPRVRTGRVVLSLARWRIRSDEIAVLKAVRAADRAEEMDRFRKRRGLPRWIVLVEGDHRLPVDLDNPLAVGTLVEELDRKTGAVLEELWPASDQSVVTGPDGHYRHELLVPLRSNKPALVRTGGTPSARPVRHRFAPGSEWLYLKLYTAPQVADRLLSEVIGPASRTWCQTGPGRRWHFLRYADPDAHLRWRLSGDRDELMEELWPAIRNSLESYVVGGQVRRLQLDTYEREVERYGGSDAIHLAEALFCHDSEAVISLLEAMAPGDAGLDERWRMAIRGMDDLLIAFGLDLPARARLVERNARYGSIAEPDVGLRRQLSRRFREQRGDLERLLEAGPTSEHPLAPGVAILAQRSTAIRGTIVSLQALAAEGRLDTPLADIASSLVHMHVNRLMAGAHNAHETVIYDWLQRLYRSQIARCTPFTPNGDSYDRKEHPDREALHPVGGA